MNIAFKITPQAEDVSQLHLLAEAGEDEISFLVFAKDPVMLHGFYSFNFDGDTSINNIVANFKNVLETEPWLLSRFASKNIFYNVKEISLMPENYYSIQTMGNVCDLMFGPDKRKKCFGSGMQQGGIKLVYRIPQKLLSAAMHSFGEAAVMHSVETLGGNTAGKVMDCLVYHKSIRVVLYNEDKLQIVQYFEYSVPADVVFHLLNVCRQFNIHPAEVQLMLHGMISRQSKLYEEVHSYFLQVSLKMLPRNIALATGLQQHPQHFYTHLMSLAQCV